MTDIISPKDYKYYLEVPDPDFSPERNRAVVENSIKKYDAMRRKKLQQARDGNAERIDAVASYIRHVKLNKANNIDKYFGKEYTSYLRGDAIRAEIMSRLTIMNNKGEVIKLKF